MKQGNTLVNIVMVALALALACYLGYYAWDSFNDPFTTTYAYEYTAQDAATVRGFLVRDEQVFPEQTGILDVKRGEGEKVGVGQQVALVHRDSQAVDLQTQIDRLEEEITLLEYALGQGDGSVTGAKLDEDILQSVVQLRSAAAVSDYSRLEDQVMAMKSQVLKRDYTYGQDLSQSDLTQQRKQLVEEYKSLKSQSVGATSSITAPVSGTFSALVDGYESLLTPETIFTLTPSQLEELARRDGGPSASPGKLVVDDVWYFVAALDVEQAQRLRVGKSVTVTFSGDFSQDVDMRVEHLGDEEDGRCTAVFSSDRYLAQTLLLRYQTAEVVFESHTGLRVPKTCLRMVTRTSTDQETEAAVETNVLGLYIVINGQAEFKTVEIISEGADYYVVTPLSQSSRALRAGDEVIVRATGLYDGKLLEY